MSENFIQIVKTINETLPIHSLWDGFWVHYFKRKTLIISCSFDRIYYRNFDLIFKQVIFFNVPDEWSDTSIHGDELIRLAAKSEFKKHHPDFDLQDEIIFGIDIYIENNRSSEVHTFFIIAKHIYLQKCEVPDNNPTPEYTDPFCNEIFPCKKNRIVLK